MNDYYVGDNNIARVGSKPYIGDNNVAQNVLKGYIGDGNNKARLWYMRKPNLALYWLGDECTDVTGGWQTMAMPTTERTNRNVGYTASVPTKYTHQQHNDSGRLFDNPKAMEVYKWSNRTPYSGGIKTINKIDLSSFDTIYLICDLLYTDGTDNFINKWKVVAFDDGVTDYNSIPLKEVIYQNPTNDHWIYTYNQYTDLSKFNRVQKISIPSSITSPVYLGIQLLTNASMTVHHSLAIRAMWAGNDISGLTVFFNGVFYSSPAGTAIDNIAPVPPAYYSDFTPPQWSQLSPYYYTNKCLCLYFNGDTSYRYILSNGNITFDHNAPYGHNYNIYIPVNQTHANTLHVIARADVTTRLYFYGCYVNYLDNRLISIGTSGLKNLTSSFVEYTAALDSTKHVNYVQLLIEQGTPIIKKIWLD